MQLLSQLETSLSDLFKGTPELPEKSKKSLVKYLPKIILVVGILQLFAAWFLWQATRFVGSLYRVSDIISGIEVGPSNFQKLMMYFGIIMLVIDSIILLKAYPLIEKKLKQGWDLLFLGSVINVVYSVLNFFMYNRGFSGFLLNLVGSVIGFWLLFQIRASYTKKDS